MFEAFLEGGKQTSKGAFDNVPGDSTTSAAQYGLFDPAPTTSVSPIKKSETKSKSSAKPVSLSKGNASVDDSNVDDLFVGKVLQRVSETDSSSSIWQCIR